MAAKFSRIQAELSEIVFLAMAVKNDGTIKSSKAIQSVDKIINIAKKMGEGSE